MVDLAPRGSWYGDLPLSSNVQDDRDPHQKMFDDEDFNPDSFFNRTKRARTGLVADKAAADALQTRIAAEQPIPQTPQQMKDGAAAAALTANFGRGADPHLKATASAKAFSPPVRDAIVKAARENNIDPATALAIADRESSGDVNGKAPGSSAYGLFQMLKSERGTYGGNTQDPYEQATAWARYIKGTKAEMQRGLGRDPTGPELYLGHYFGGTRAARLVSGQVPGQTPVQALFSPQELAANPNIGRAGTTGALSSSIMSDISRRQNKFSDVGTGPSKDVEPTEWGTPVGPVRPNSAPSAPTAGPVPFTSPPPSPLDQPARAPISQPAPSAPPPQQDAVPPMPPAMAPPGGGVPYTSGQSIVG